MHTTLLIGTLCMLTGCLLAANDAAPGGKAAAEKFAGRHGKRLEHAAAGALSNVVRRIDQDVDRAESAAAHEARKAAHAARRDAALAEKNIGTLGQAVKTEIADREKPTVPPAADVVPPAEDVKPVLPPIDKSVKPVPATATPAQLGAPTDVPAAVAPDAPVKIEAATATVPAPAPAAAAAAEKKAEPARKKWWKFWSKD